MGGVGIFESICYIPANDNKLIVSWGRNIFQENVGGKAASKIAMARMTPHMIRLFRISLSVLVGLFIATSSLGFVNTHLCHIRISIISEI